MKKRIVEVFTAGCACCDDAVKLVRSIACPSCDVQVHDMHSDKAARAKAKKYGVRSVPAVVIDGKLAHCCAGRGIEESSLRGGGIGSPLS